MKRLLLSILCGLLITAALTVIAFSDKTSDNTARILLWQVMLLAQHVPHGNIGTPEHPVYEGSPLDLVPVFLGVPLGIPIYAVVSYAALWLVAKVQRRNNVGDK
jgi:hypothetical protein